MCIKKVLFGLHSLHCHKPMPLNISTLSIPESIKIKLNELSDSISINKQMQKGSNGYLFFGINNISKLNVALKFYIWSGNSIYHAEPRNLASLRSENIIPIFDAAIVDEKYAYFMTPYFNSGDLDDIINKGIFSNLSAISYVRDILSGLSHLHAIRLLHRDLKPQNIFVSDSNHAVIGDFGSVKYLPVGIDSVSGSNHSLIYRPPESVSSNTYSMEGDIYQVGMVLFQLLGGSLPYEETAWLNSVQLNKYLRISDDIDRQIYASGIIKNRIKYGRIIDIRSLPPWVCNEIRKTISKACNREPNKRYQSCSEFLTRISTIRSKILDWRIENGNPTLFNTTNYRIITDSETNSLKVQKCRTGVWRNDNSFSEELMENLVEDIENRFN